MLDKPQGFASTGEPEAALIGALLESESAPQPTARIHPAVFTIALSGVAWFLAVAWLNFAGKVKVDLVLSVVTGFFVMFFTLFLVAASMIVNDPRWRQRKTSFTKFIEDDIPIDSYTMRGSRCADSDNLAAGDTRRRRHSYWLDLVDRSLGVVSNYEAIDRTKIDSLAEMNAGPASPA